MPYVVKVGKKGFLNRSRVESFPTIYHHPSSYRKAIESFEAQNPDKAGQCVPYKWVRGELENV